MNSGYFNIAFDIGIGFNTFVVHTHTPAQTYTDDDAYQCMKYIHYTKRRLLMLFVGWVLRSSVWVYSIKLNIYTQYTVIWRLIWCAFCHWWIQFMFYQRINVHIGCSLLASLFLFSSLTISHIHFVHINLFKFIHQLILPVDVCVIHRNWMLLQLPN